MRSCKRMMVLCTVAVTAAVLFLSGAALCTAEAPASESIEEQINEALEFAQKLGIGWNLGNTFDAPEGELSWGNPMVTKELLMLVKELGFDTIRIPISWGLHNSGAPDYIINDTFLNRIDLVVNQALDTGLYVIINSHHDNDIYSPKAGNSEQGEAYLNAIWTQVGEHFKDKDEHLIFETMNEPRVVGTTYEWNINTNNPDCVDALRVVNDLNQTALDAIRATGGRNADRYVIISVYAGSLGAALSEQFCLPEDSAENRLMVSVHAYTPYNFALNMVSKDKDFGKAQLAEIKTLLKNCSFRFNRKGIPVIIDEMGCINKDNPEARYEWAKAFVSEAKSYGIPCVWWDNGIISGSGERFGLIDRRHNTLYEQSRSVYEGLMEGITGLPTGGEAA